MKLPAISNGQAQIIIGLVGIGIALYAIYQTKDTIGKAAQATADALNPTKDTNLAYKATTGLLGEDFVIDNIGGGVASLVNWFKKDDKQAQKAVPVALKTESKKITPAAPVGTGVLVSLKNDPIAAKKESDSFWGQFK